MTSTSAALREEDKTLLVAILTGVTPGRMGFDRIGDDMKITKRAATERWTRLKKKLWGKNLGKEFSLREDDKSLLLAILKGLTAADMDFERVGKDMGGISKRAATERYNRLRTKLWGKKGKEVKIPASKVEKARSPKKVNYKEDEGESADESEDNHSAKAIKGGDDIDNDDAMEVDEASEQEREDQDNAAVGQQGYVQSGDEDVDEFHDASDELQYTEA